VYLVVLFSCCFVLFVDGIVVFVDFNRSGYISKMRQVVEAEKEESKTYMEQMSLQITDNLTYAADH
jgi:hypothetical protein